MDLQVRLDQPMVAVLPDSLKQKGMRPGTPFFALIKVPLGPANRLVHQCHAAGQADSSGTGIALQKLLVREAGDDDRFARRGVRLHAENLSKTMSKATAKVVTMLFVF